MGPICLDCPNPALLPVLLCLRCASGLVEASVFCLAVRLFLVRVCNIYFFLFSLVSDDLGPTSIYLNSTFQPNQTEVVLVAGSAFSLSCHGNGSVRWFSTAFRLVYQNVKQNPIEVRTSDTRHTGTYCCNYTNESLGHLHTWIHLYVKGKLKWSRP